MAVGEKVSSTLMAVGMFFNGFVLAFILGWKFAFVSLGMLPFVIASVLLLTIVLQKGYESGTKAFKVSASAAS